MAMSLQRVTQSTSCTATTICLDTVGRFDTFRKG